MVIVSTLPKVVIDLKPGMYAYDAVSGSGKTALTSLVSPHTAGPEASMIVCSRADEVPAVLSKQWELVLIDRFDMWGTTELAHKIAGAAKHAVVLVDVKQGFTEMPWLCEYCYVHTDGRSVLVNDIPT